MWCWHKDTTQKLAQNDYKYLTVKAKSLKLLDENIRLNLHDLGFVNVFLNITTSLWYIILFIYFSLLNVPWVVA